MEKQVEDHWCKNDTYTYVVYNLADGASYELWIIARNVYSYIFRKHILQSLDPGENVVGYLYKVRIRSFDKCNTDTGFVIESRRLPQLFESIIDFCNIPEPDISAAADGQDNIPDIVNCSEFNKILSVQDKK